MSSFPIFLRLLNEYGVDFLVVGRHASDFYDCAGFEQDADLVVLPKVENIRRLLPSLADVGFGHLGISAQDFVGHTTVTLHRAPHRLDLMTYVPGLDLDAVWSRRVAGTLRGVPVHFIGQDDLLGNRPSSSSVRAEDLARLAS